MSVLQEALAGLPGSSLYGSVISFDGCDLHDYLSSSAEKPIRRSHFVRGKTERNGRVANADRVLAHTSRGFLSALAPPHCAIGETSNFIREIGDRLDPQADYIATLAITTDDAPVETHLYLE
jgi:hypothetical protein